MHSFSMNAAAARAVAIVSATASPMGAPTEVTTPSLKTGSSSPRPMRFSPPGGMSATVMNALKSGYCRRSSSWSASSVAAFRVKEKRACGRELFTIAACSPPAGSGTSCVYWTSPEACTNAARLMIGLRHGEELRILGVLLRPRRKRSVVMIRRRHDSPAATCFGSTASGDVEEELVEEVLRQLSPVRPADPFLVHLVLGTRCIPALPVSARPSAERRVSWSIGLPARNCSVLRGAPDHRSQAAVDDGGFARLPRARARSGGTGTRR